MKVDFEIMGRFELVILPHKYLRIPYGMIPQVKLFLILKNTSHGKRVKGCGNIRIDPHLCYLTLCKVLFAES